MNGLRQRMAKQTVDMVAQEFEKRVARGGFYIVGAAIPLYIAEMQRYWQEQVKQSPKATPGKLPTSPHKVAGRQKLGLVRVPRIIIQARDRALDGSLTSEIVTRFQKAIVDAYQTGDAQLAQVGGSQR